ncbi:MAG: dephospho-CoA kinase [Pseudomonadota bacterium]
MIETPLRIGLTGGIASGKSAAARFFSELGVPVIDTDIIAREVVKPGSAGLEGIRERFGSGVLDDDGTLNRAVLRAVVFADPAKREVLEAILHPLIRAETVRQAEAAGGDYQVIVVPLLVESPLKAFVDRVLLVDCSEETQIRRLLARDGGDEASARQILAAQASREQRLAIADDVIGNENTLQDLQTAVAELHRRYCQTVGK